MRYGAVTFVYHPGQISPTRLPGPTSKNSNVPLGFRNLSRATSSARRGCAKTSSSVTVLTAAAAFVFASGADVVSPPEHAVSAVAANRARIEVLIRMEISRFSTLVNTDAQIGTITQKSSKFPVGSVNRPDRNLDRPQNCSSWLQSQFATNCKPQNTAGLSLQI